MAPKHRSIQNFNQTYTEQFEPIIMIVPSHEIIDKTVHQLMEILEHVSTPKRGIVVIGPGNIGSVKNISDVPHREVELLQPIEIELITHKESEDWNDQIFLAAQKDISRSQKNAAKHYVPKPQSAKKVSSKSYRQRKK